MKQKVLLSSALLIALSHAGIAQDRGYWKAESKTAKSITGDISIAEERLMIYYAPFVISQIRTLKPEEIAGSFHFEADEAATGNLYRLSVPADRRFLHKNTLCGDEETQWMATAVSGKTLQVAFLTGAKMPDLSAEAQADSNRICGTYTYSR